MTFSYRLSRATHLSLLHRLLIFDVPTGISVKSFHKPVITMIMETDFS